MRLPDQSKAPTAEPRRRPPLGPGLSPGLGLGLGQGSGQGRGLQMVAEAKASAGDRGTAAYIKASLFSARGLEINARFAGLGLGAKARARAKARG